MRRGSVYWINLEPVAPPELGKTRPAIILSSTVYNERLASVVVVPLSTRAPEIWPLRLEVSGPGIKRSFAVIPGIRQVSTARLHQQIGRATTAVTARLTEAVTLYLGE
jgi:mRNA-degrading endonuclease toxin of MazEF toxin-antitoxin module